MTTTLPRAEVTVRPLTTIDDLREMQRLDSEVWAQDAIPLHQTLTVARNGGIVLGAFDGEELIGLCYGFPGFNGDNIYLCSHMLAVDSRYRGSGIGEKLKQYQRKVASEAGYRLITWTYDPLESVNAFLNLSKLGAVCDTYIENCYGDMADPLNRGLASDRFQVAWWIESRHVAESPSRYISFNRDSILVDWQMGEGGFPVLADGAGRLIAEKIGAGLERGRTGEFPRELPSELPSELANENLRQPERRRDNRLGHWLLPVPAQFQRMKKEAISLAHDWRQKTRGVFQTLFANGYAATAVIGAADEPVRYYVLQQKEALDLLR